MATDTPTLAGELAEHRPAAQEADPAGRRPLPRLRARRRADRARRPGLAVHLHLPVRHRCARLELHHRPRSRRTRQGRLHVGHPGLDRADDHRLLVAIPIGFAAAHLPREVRLPQPRPARRGRDRCASGASASCAPGAGGLRLLVQRMACGASFLWARVGPPINRVVEVNISNLAAVPSIIYGLLGLAVFVTFIGFNKSLLAGGLTLALLVLPIIIIASREAIRAVPGLDRAGRDGARRDPLAGRLAPGRARRPCPGMLTGTILAMSRAIGEAAPLIVVGGVVFGTQMPSLNPLERERHAPVRDAAPDLLLDGDRPQSRFPGARRRGHHRAARRADRHERRRDHPAQQVQPSLVRRPPPTTRPTSTTTSTNHR